MEATKDIKKTEELLKANITNWAKAAIGKLNATVDDNRLTLDEVTKELTSTIGSMFITVLAAEVMKAKIKNNKANIEDVIDKGLAAVKADVVTTLVRAIIHYESKGGNSPA